MTEITAQRETVELPLQRREAAVVPSSVHAATRTAELVWSTGARVKRGGFFTEPYHEELSLQPEHVRMERLNNGAPLLDSHNRYDLRGVIGVVEKAWIEGKEARAIVRFSDREEVEPVFRDVQNGIVRNVSVGYQVHKFEDVTQENSKDNMKLLRAVDWEPMELSLVPIGADGAAGVRNHDDEQTNACVIIRAVSAPNPEEETTMTQQATANQPAADKPESGQRSQEDVDAARKQAHSEATTAERKRATEIRQLTRKVKLPENFADGLIDRDITIDAARAAIIDEIARQEPAPTRNIHVAAGDLDETVTRRQAVQQSLLVRYDPGRYELTEPARDYRGLSLLDLAREVCGWNGIQVRGLHRLELAQRAMHSTSDFPEILANVANKTLRAAYESSPRTFLTFCRQNTAVDFKQISRTQLGGAPSLEKVNEHGEFKYGTIGEGAEKYQLATYGKIIAVTRQLIVNDDLGAFTRIPEMFGRAAADLESDIVWGIITANAALNDGIALFHLSHNNLAGAGTAITVAALGAARASMRRQKGLEGRLINVRPEYLLVPAAKETEAQQIINATIVATKTTDTNPFRGSLEVIAEPRLDDNSAVSWYLSAAPAQIDTIEYAYLEGNEGVQTESRMGFNIDGMEVRARHDFAAKAIDFRGLYRNPGA